MKEKRDCSLKGRSVADGRKQRGLYPKEETTSPTVSIDALFLSLLIDSWEEREVATADVPGAYLLADMPDRVIVRYKNEMVDIICSVDPSYKKYVVSEGKDRVLYLSLLKALYGCVQSALLWYDLFSKTLQEVGFRINPYDRCVANCDVGGSQCTIVWYVDDVKISHKRKTVVGDILKKTRKQAQSQTRSNLWRYE